VPLYEYQCSSCGHRFEKIRKFSDGPYRKCPKCGKLKAEQMLSAPAAHFKGEGWYVTDYQRKGSSQGSSDSGGKVESSASSDSKDAKSESKSESKPETKSESKSESKSDSSSKSKSESRKS